jgi:RNA polymerase sigma-70 factor (ECF subfamily)
LNQPNPIIYLVPDDDAALVARAAEGDQKAFTALYRRHSRYVAGVIFRLLRDDSDLDDVMQQAFVFGYRQLASLRDPAAFRTWIVSIAVRHAYRVLSRRRRFAWLISGELSRPVATDPQEAERMFEWYQALDSIPVKLRVPWMLHHIEGLTLHEVAHACDISTGTVKRRLSDADARLKRRIDVPR